MGMTAVTYTVVTHTEWQRVTLELTAGSMHVVGHSLGMSLKIFCIHINTMRNFIRVIR